MLLRQFVTPAADSTAGCEVASDADVSHLMWIPSYNKKMAKIAVTLVVCFRHEPVITNSGQCQSGCGFSLQCWGKYVNGASLFTGVLHLPVFSPQQDSCAYTVCIHTHTPSEVTFKTMFGTQSKQKCYWVLRSLFDNAARASSCVHLMVGRGDIRVCMQMCICNV